MLTRLRTKSPLVYPGDRLPGFDPTHPAAGTKVGASVYGGFTNLLKPAAPTISGTYAQTVDGSIGNCAAISSGVAGTATFTNFANSLTTQTLACIIRWVTLNSGPTNLINNGNALRVSAANALQITFGASGIASGLSLTPGQSYFIAASGLSATKVNFIIRNLQTGSISQATVTTAITLTGTSSTIVLGTSSALSGYRISCAMGSAVFLSPAQLLAWADDPFSFWYPPRVEQIIGLSLAKSQIISPPKLGTWVVDWS